MQSRYFCLSTRVICYDLDKILHIHLNMNIYYLQLYSNDMIFKKKFHFQLTSPEFISLSRFTPLWLFDTVSLVPLFVGVVMPCSLRLGLPKNLGLCLRGLFGVRFPLGVRGERGTLGTLLGASLSFDSTLAWLFPSWEEEEKK